MKKRMIQTMTVVLTLILMILTSATAKNVETKNTYIKREIEEIATMPVIVPQEVSEPLPVEVEIVTAAPKMKETEAEVVESEVKIEEEEVVESEIKEEPAPWTSEEIELANLVEAEAGNQGLRGKQLVADVVLNRVDSSEFPDTIHDVIFQRNQFTVTVNGQFNYWSSRISEESLLAARTELTGPRIDYGILYFNSGDSCANGSGGWKHKDHWFAY